MSRQQDINSVFKQLLEQPKRVKKREKEVDYICSICLTKEVNVLVSRCGHKFCLTCFKGWYEYLKQQVCPSCAEEFIHYRYGGTLVYCHNKYSEPPYIKNPHIEHCFDPMRAVRLMGTGYGDIHTSGYEVDSSESIRKDMVVQRLSKILCLRGSTELRHKFIGAKLFLCPHNPDLGGNDDETLRKTGYVLNRRNMNLPCRMPCH